MVRQFILFLNESTTCDDVILQNGLKNVHVHTKAVYIKIQLKITTSRRDRMKTYISYFTNIYFQKFIDCLKSLRIRTQLISLAAQLNHIEICLTFKVVNTSVL